MAVTVFVSYARGDHSLWRLRKIESRVLEFGEPYIDDLHGLGAPDRRRHVKERLEAASVFLAVSSPAYFRTAWTRWELLRASTLGTLMMALAPSGEVSAGTPREWRTQDLRMDVPDNPPWSRTIPLSV